MKKNIKKSRSYKAGFNSNSIQNILNNMKDFSLYINNIDVRGSSILDKISDLISDYEDVLYVNGKETIKNGSEMVDKLDKFESDLEDFLSNCESEKDVILKEGEKILLELNKLI